jgi:hypothetical protein
MGWTEPERKEREEKKKGDNFLILEIVIFSHKNLQVLNK